VHWPKTERLQQCFVEAITQSSDDDARLLGLLLDQQQPADVALPDTGVGLELERLLAPIFVRGSAHYGTRASTLAYVRDDGTAFVRERTFAREGNTENEIAWQHDASALAWRRAWIEAPG
jgi:uncharacterized protein with NRDE domain